MSMRVWLFCFSNLERRLWGGAVHTNNYFSSFVLAFSAIMGAALRNSVALSGVLPSDFSINALSLVALLVILLGFLLCESVCACEGVGVILMRALLSFVATLAMFIVGYLLSYVGLVVSLLWLFMLVGCLLLAAVRKLRQGV